MTAVDDTVPVPACPEEVAAAGAAGQPARGAAAAQRARRRSRPLLGPVFMLAGAIELLVTLRLARPGWPAGETALSVPLQFAVVIVLTGCAAATWLFPVHRTAFSTVAILAGIAALLTADLGGFAAGTLLSAAGGALGFAWVPPGRPRRPSHQDRAD